MFETGMLAEITSKMDITGVWCLAARTCKRLCIHPGRASRVSRWLYPNNIYYDRRAFWEAYGC